MLSALLIYTIWVKGSLRIIASTLSGNHTEKIKLLKKLGHEFGQIGELIEKSNAQKDELRIARNKAEESDKLKSSFLANLSHEIRTPMNGIIGFSELISDPNIPNDLKKHYQKYINNSCNDLLYIINDILDISKIEAGQIEVSEQYFSVNELFDELFEIFDPELDKVGKGHINLRFNKPIDDSNCIISSDRIKIKHVLTKLLDNATKFTDSGSIEVVYKLTNEGDIVFSVKDTGIGIAADKTGVIFDRFRQINGSETRLYGGNGLGLSICKGLIELMQGEIWVDSEITQGSTFYFKLPYKPAHIPADHCSIDYNWLGKRLLLIENDDIIALHLQSILTKTGIEVIRFVDPVHALSFLKNTRVDLILTDAHFPETKGWDTTALIREQLSAKVPIIAQTSGADRKKYIQAGCNDLLSKPVKKDELLTMLDSYLIKQ
jgi:signal transduction histidine kinase/CheY-like chemotaxis protein